MLALRFGLDIDNLSTLDDLSEHSNEKLKQTMEVGKMLVQQHDLTNQIESITVNLRPYISRIVTDMSKLNAENGQILCDYINSELVERNIADSTREWKLKNADLAFGIFHT